MVNEITKFIDFAKKAQNPTVYIQDGKRFINDDTQLDRSRPYQQVDKDGPRFVTPPVRDTTWDSPDPDTAERIQSAPPPRTLEENTQRFREIDRSIVVPEKNEPPAMPQSRAPELPDFVNDDAVTGRFSRAVKTARPNIDTYYGNSYQPGFSINDNLIKRLDNPTLSTQEKIELSNVLEQSTARDIVHEFAAATWEQLTPRDKEIFIGTAAIQTERFTPATRNRFENLVATDGGQAEMFANLLDYVLTSKAPANEDLVDIYERLGLVARRPEEQRTQSPITSKDYSNTPYFGRALDALMKTATGVLDEGAFNTAIQGLSGVSPTVRSNVQMQTALTMKEIINSVMTPSDDDIDMIYKVKEQAPLDTALYYLDEREIGYLRASHSELAELPMDVFLQTLSVNPNSVGVGQLSDSRLSLEQRAASGLLSPAEQQWFSMGLSQDAITHLNKFITMGGVRDISPELRELATETRNHLMKKQNVLDWLLGQGKYASLSEQRNTADSTEWMMGVPSDLIKDLSPQDMYELGFPEEVIREKKPSGSIPVISGIFNGINWALNALESWHDREAARTIGNPLDGFQDPQSIWERFGASAASQDFTTPEMRERLAEVVTHPEFVPGGKYDTKLADIFNSPFLTSEEREAIEDIAADLSIADRDDNGQLFYPTVKVFVDLIESGTPVSDAIEQVGTWRSIVTRSALGWDMMLMPFGGLVSRGANAGIRGALKIPEYLEVSAPSLRGLRAGAVVSLSDDASLIDNLILRKNQIEAELEAAVRNVRTVETGATRGLGTTRQSGFVDELVDLTPKQTAQLTDELAEINRVISNPTDDVILRADILDPAVLPKRYSTGDSLADIFQVYNPLRRTIKASDGTKIGDEVFRGIRGFAGPRDFFSRLSSGDALRGTEFSQRASVINNAFMVTDQIGQIFRKVPRGTVATTSLSDEGQTLISRYRDVLQDVVSAGRTDTAGKFVQDYLLDDYVTDRMYKTLDLVGNDVDLATFRTLNYNSRIALNDEHFRQLMDEAIERVKKNNPKMGNQEVYNLARGNVFRSEQEFYAHLMNEVNASVTEAVSQRILGKSFDEVGAAIKVQDKINGALSMFMLESPGFVIRNMVSNMAAATLDGALPWKTFGRSPDYIRKYSEVFGINPLAFSFSPRGAGVAEMRDLETTFVRELFQGGWKGGGIPGFGGIPFMSFRRAAAHFEAVNRSRIIQQEASRFVTQMWNEQTFLTSLRTYSPEAAQLLDELAATGASTEEFYANLFKAVTDHGTLDMDNIVRFISNITADGRQMALSVDISPVRIAEELGFHTPHLNQTSLTSMREIMSSYDPDLVDLATLVNRSNDEAVRNIKLAGEKFGVPGDAVDDIVDIYDVLFHSAKQAGMTPKDASDFALNVSTASSFRLRGIYERNQTLLDYINDPEVYRNAIFPYANGIRKSTADVADLVRVPSTPYTRKKELYDLLNEEDEMLGWKGASDIIDAAKQLKEPLDTSGELGLRIQRTVENLSQLRQAEAQYSRPVASQIQKAQDEAIAYHERTFNPQWPTERKQAYLKSQVLKIAELGSDVKISSNANSTLVRVYLRGAKPAEVRRAIDELIDDGTLARRYIEGSKQGNRYVLEVADQPTGKSVLDNPELAQKFEQYVEDIVFLADRVAEARIADAAPSIRAFNTNLRRSQRKTMEELRNSLMNEMSSGNVDPHTLSALANTRLDAYATRTKERFNQIADKLQLQRAPMDADQESWLLGRYYGENSPSFFTQTVAENVPTVSFYRDMVQSDAFTEYGRDKFAAMRTAVRSMQAENARVNGHPLINVVMREADPQLYADVTFTDLDTLRLATDEANSTAKSWASNVPAYHEYTLPGWNKTVSEPITFSENAPIAEIPDGVNVVPANYGMADDTRTPGVPTRGVWGRTFMQRPPAGFRAVITTDDWKSIGLKGNQYGTRFALFVRNGTTQEEFTRSLRTLAQQHYGTKVNKTVLSSIDETGREALLQNPSGYYASFQTKSSVQVTQELKPMLALAEQGDEIAMQVVQYARQQWRSGWPIAGHPNRTLKDVYDNFARSAQANTPFGNYYTLMTPQQGQALLAGIRRVIVDKNKLMDVGMSLGQARADWILHNYNNVNDLDFMMRWLGPWHIWPTRTMGKLTTRIVDNPQFYVGYAAFDTALDVANEDLPEYMQNNIPIDWALQALQVPLLASTIGLSSFGIEGATLNANSLFFYNDLIGDYGVAGEGSTKLGRLYDTVEDFLPVNPAFGWGMSLTGQFGDKDITGEIERLMRPAEIGMHLVSEVANWADAPIPNQLIMSQRDINDVNLEYAVSIMEAIELHGKDSKEVQQLVESFDEWGRMSKGGFRLPIFQYIGAQFGMGEMDATTVAVMRNASRNRVIGNSTSYLLGHKLSLPQGDRQKLWDAMEQFRDVLSKEYKTDAERTDAINRVFDDPVFGEAMSAYLRNNNDSSDLNTMAQAESLWFSGLEDINSEFDSAYSQLRSTGSNVTSEENAEALTKLYLAKTAQQIALAAEIEQETGINPQTHENFSISYRVNGPELADLLLNIKIEDLDLSLIDDSASFKGQSTPIMENIDMLAGGKAKDELIKEVKAYAERTGTEPQFVTIGQINLDRVSTEATSLLITLENATSTNDLYQMKDGQYTNAIDFERMFDEEAKVLEGMTDGQRLIVEQIRLRSQSPNEIIDRAINEWVRTTTDNYYGILKTSTEQKWHDAQTAAMLEQAKTSYKAPTSKEIMAVLDEMTKGLWRQNNDLSEADMINLVGERLKNAEKIGDLNTILTGNFDDNIGALAAGLGRLEELRNMPQTAETAAEMRALTGYTEDGKWVAGTLRHFTTPNGYVITNTEELNEFREAYRTNKEMSAMYEQGVFPNGDLTDRDSSYYLWAKYFKKDFNESMSKAELLNHLASTNQWQLFDQVRQFYDSGKDEPTRDNNIYNPDGSIRRPESGVPSAGRDITRAGGNYRFVDLGSNVTLSRNGGFTKAYLERHFTGAKSDNMPPDYLFELLAQNGVTEETEIMDFFWSIYEMAEPMYGDIFMEVDDVAFTLFSYTNGDKENGRPQVSTYQYLLGIRGMYDTIFGKTQTSHVGSSSSGSGRTSSGSSRTTSSSTSGRSSTRRNVEPVSRAPKLPKDWNKNKQAAAPSNRGVGGMPEWTEAVNYMKSVFHDDRLLEDVIMYFNNNNHRMTNNHMRMMRTMYQTFPIGSASSFNEWLSALKLMFKTAEIMNVRTRSIENPASFGDINPPRLAKYR